MLVNLNEILEKAKTENYAVLMPDVCTELDARAVIEAAENLNAPLILGVCAECNFDVSFTVSYLRIICENSAVPIAIMLDHGKTFRDCLIGIRSGVTSIMVDRSQMPYVDNVREVKELVKIAHSLGISVEAELGHVGEGANYIKDRNVGLTSPHEAERFVMETGIDALAVAIGTAHGTYVGEPFWILICYNA